MRINTREAFNAWSQGNRLRKCSAIWTDGKALYSYSTPIVGYSDDGAIILNESRYSKTTSTHQNAIRTLLVGPHRRMNETDFLNNLKR